MKSEAAVQAEVRIRAAELGVRLWRNNVGVAEDKTGRPIRYGLANDSPQMNKRLKSSDLVGWIPKSIFRDDLRERGYKTFGVFLSAECKHEGWTNDPLRYSEREKAQAAWIALVIEGGGIAGFVASVADFDKLLGVGDNG